MLDLVLDFTSLHIVTCSTIWFELSDWGAVTRKLLRTPDPLSHTCGEGLSMRLPRMVQHVNVCISIETSWVSSCFSSSYGISVHTRSISLHLPRSASISYCLHVHKHGGSFCCCFPSYSWRWWCHMKKLYLIPGWISSVWNVVQRPFLLHPQTLSAMETRLIAQVSWAVSWVTITKKNGGGEYIATCVWHKRTLQTVLFWSDGTSGVNVTATPPTFKTGGLCEEGRARALTATTADLVYCL